MNIASKARRLFVGDLHGCLSELNALLESFRFHPGRDKLYSVGDLVGKGPDVLGTLHRLRALDALAVLGNHDFELLQSARDLVAGKKPKHLDYLESLGTERDEWLAWFGALPFHLDLEDIILVHAGMEPGKKNPDDMKPRILMEIRTWDGKGTHLNRAEDPPWFECVKPDKTIVFGHWAKRGLVNLPRFKGLDTGCVYGGKLTGWCPEEDRFLQVDAKRAYAPIHFHRF